MLASIHPLGERARQRRWGVTMSAYLFGSALAAAVFGAVLGGIGALLAGPVPTRSGISAVLIVALCALGLAFDLHLGGIRLPTIHRQVDKDWLDRYRGWVVGVGFGLQLGVGVVTIVNTAAVYATFTVALLSGSARAGLVVGTTFGLVRAVVLLVVVRVRRPDQLRAVLRRMQDLHAVSRSIAVAVQAAVMVAVGTFAIAH